MLIAELRQREFGRLDAQHHVYLDYTGSALYGESQLRAHQRCLETQVFGNPHSESSTSRAATDMMDAARRMVLRFLDADESTHDVVFTANTTAAIKLVAESYPFTPDSSFVLSVDNHNSVNGVREYARRAGAQIRYIPLDDELRLEDVEQTLMSVRPGLLAFPAQSNFSGVRHPLSLVALAKQRGFDVLLDIAAYAPSQAFSLRQCPADFVALSFYKLFGYPTGLGALVARRDALVRLRRPWFSGGTVMYASVQVDTHRLRPAGEAFEDGTPDFLGIAALEPGFALLGQVSMPQIAAHVCTLTSTFLERIQTLRHRSGEPLVRIYGPRDMRDRGGAVAFNLRDAEGRTIPYWVVEERAREADVSLRGGCFCNPGGSEAAFGLDGDRIAACLSDVGAAFTVERFSSCLGEPVGALRVSVGLANNLEDIERAVAVLASFRT